jgi:hypothetical protein
MIQKEKFGFKKQRIATMALVMLTDFPALLPTDSFDKWRVIDGIFL